jgi:hypothetical protein
MSRKFLAVIIAAAAISPAIALAWNGGHPNMTVVKLQRDGTTGSFTTSPITANVGDTIYYEIQVTNTGDTDLTLSLSDPHCDAGTIAGPTAVSGTLSGNKLIPGGVAQYTCSHVVQAGDAPAFTNQACVTGTPPTPGTPPTETQQYQCSSVTANVPSPQSPAPQTPSPAAAPSTGVSGTAPSKAPPKATVSAVHGPAGCVHTAFSASLHATNVKSVTFFLGKRKLRTLRPKNAHKGIYKIKVPTANLSVGTHRLFARVTTASGVITRSLTVVRCAHAAVSPEFTG